MKNKLFISCLLISNSFFAQTTEAPIQAFDFLASYQNIRDIAISTNQEEVYFTIQSPDEQVSKIAFVTNKIQLGLNRNWFLFQVLIEILNRFYQMIIYACILLQTDLYMIPFQRVKIMTFGMWKEKAQKKNGQNLRTWDFLLIQLKMNFIHP